MIEWSKPEDRLVHNGVDRGVIYVGDQAYAWNGITGFDESGNGDSSIYYIDGRVYLADVDPTDFNGKISAYSWPDKFSECLGIPEIADGLYVDNQKPKQFDFCYRTLIGSGSTGDLFGYQIHLVYNAIATFAGRKNRTLTQDPDIQEFDFDIVCTPVELNGFRPSAHYIIDTRHLSPLMVQVIETALYGLLGNDPTMIPPGDLYDVLNFGSAITFVDHGDGTWTSYGSYQNLENHGDGTWTIRNVDGIDHGDGTYTLQDTP